MLKGCSNGDTLFLSGWIIKNDNVPELKGTKICLVACGNDVSLTLGPLPKDIADEIGISALVFIGEDTILVK